MQSNTKPLVAGKVAQVEMCPYGGSLTLVIGPVSLRLDPCAAEDVKATLAQALFLLSPQAKPNGNVEPRPSAETGSN